jgi:hypothetical protein
MIASLVTLFVLGVTCKCRNIGNLSFVAVAKGPA